MIPKNITVYQPGNTGFSLNVSTQSNNSDLCSGSYLKAGNIYYLLDGFPRNWSRLAKNCA